MDCATFKLVLHYFHQGNGGWCSEGCASPMASSAGPNRRNWTARRQTPVSSSWRWPPASSARSVAGRQAAPLFFFYLVMSKILALNFFMSFFLFFHSEVLTICFLNFIQIFLFQNFVAKFFSFLLFSLIFYFDFCLQLFYLTFL